MFGALRDLRGPERKLVLQRTAMVLGAGIVLGIVAGVVWWIVTPLPGYLVGDDGLASINERGLARVFAADAWFTMIGVVGGAAIGLLGAAQLGRRLGWLAVVVVVVSTMLAALICWGVGSFLGPGEFSGRLAEAQPGEVVPLELTLRSRVALLAWPFLGLLPMLLWATLARDPEEPRPIRTPWRTWREWRARNTTV